MAFDKKEYWANRRAGKRGQGVELKPVYHPPSNERSTKPLSKYAIRKNTKRVRKHPELLTNPPSVQSSKESK